MFDMMKLQADHRREHLLREAKRERLVRQARRDEQDEQSETPTLKREMRGTLRLEPDMQKSR